VYFASNPANGTPVVVPVYARLPGRQNIEAGQYADVVHVVILF
jgi:spore coat protein U-like protein